MAELQLEVFKDPGLTCGLPFFPRKVDKDFIPGLMYIRDNEATSEEFEAMSLPFTVPSASGQDIQLSSKYTHITLDNRAEYVRLAINYRWGHLPSTVLVQ